MTTVEDLSVHVMVQRLRPCQLWECSVDIRLDELDVLDSRIEHSAVHSVDVDGTDASGVRCTEQRRE